MLNAKIKKLSNNLTIVTDYIPTVSSATVGLWSNIGSRVENDKNSGICHFLEHMVFKGTKNRTAFQLSEEIEARGGYMNAWTSKEKTTWYAKVLKEDVVLAMDIIFDMLLNSTYKPDLLEKERGVILEEIKMYLDSPSDTAHTIYDKLAYKGSSLAMPIIGSKETVSSFLSNDFSNHINSYYYPSNMVLVVSGNFNEDEFLNKATEFAKNWQDKSVSTKQNQAEISFDSEVFVKKEIEQASLVYGLKGYSYKDDNYYNALALNTVLGGGMSSRFWIKIREEEGLAYSVDSYLNTYSDCGTFTVSVGCDADNVNKVIGLIRQEMSNAVNNISEKELQKAKNQIKSGIIMGLESTYNRANKIANNILDFGIVKNINESITKIDNISLNNINGVLNELLSSKEIIAVVSPKDIKIS
jgi:predicted Zn-dependent peptidase